ncbi:hypothetical protein HPP92_020119 [Vanilla planifolia]|uniref:Disease resistance R13L4/SHOC-2-like LRR domain-containing protein n=1 Tax=Vanilla planifolia TaxID=51239 RepID=A0A835UMF7_VANPL|nr:hypothetical protein HPP92_020119 [Vanilla planifolia]
MSSHFHTTEDVVKEIMRIHRCLQPRPSVDEVEAALAIVRDVDKEERLRNETISKQQKAAEIPEELFLILKEMQRGIVHSQSKAQRREAMKLLDLENIHALLDQLVWKASDCLRLGSNVSVSATSVGSSAAKAASSPSGLYSEKNERGRNEIIGVDDFYINKTIPAVKPSVAYGDEQEKLSLIKLASIIEISSKKGTPDLNLHNKLMDEVDWLPNSIGKLSFLLTLDLSENSIIAIPNTIGSLSSLKSLDFRANQITELPSTIGNLLHLHNLQLSSNLLTFLPSTLGKLLSLAELDLSYNRLDYLPDAIGHLVNLKKLNIEANNIEELPHTIGNCSSLVELRANYNHLKCLPEAIGRLDSLEILFVRYNNIKGLPTTMASLSRLKEVDVSFNELESIPESLCLLTTLVKLNVGNNFADLKSLPRAIGNLEMLVELDINNNQIKVLPDSFGMLTQLCVLKVEGNPLEVPPKQVTEMGAQAVVHYMAEMVARRAVRSLPSKSKKGSFNICIFTNPSRRTNHDLDNVKS